MQPTYVLPAQRMASSTPDASARYMAGRAWYVRRALPIYNEELDLDLAKLIEM